MAVKWRFLDKSEYESVWEMFSRLIWIQIHIDGHLVTHDQVAILFLPAYSIVWKVMLAFTRAMAVMDAAGMS